MSTTATWCFSGTTVSGAYVHITFCLLNSHAVSPTFQLEVRYSDSASLLGLSTSRMADPSFRKSSLTVSQKTLAILLAEALQLVTSVEDTCAPESGVLGPKVILQPML